MISLIVAAVLLSIDSVVVSFALGTCRLERRPSHRLAAAFGVCDAAASLVALSVGFSAAGQLAFFGQWGAPALLVVYAFVTLALSWLGQGMAQTGTRRGKALLYLIPIAMGFDNLAASSELPGAGALLASAIVIGVGERTRLVLRLPGWRGRCRVGAREVPHATSGFGGPLRRRRSSCYWRPCWLRYKIIVSVRAIADPERFQKESMPC